MTFLSPMIVLAALTVPPPLQPPSTTTLVAAVQAGGVQVYACRVAASGSGAWTFVGPEAVLYDATGQPFGSHTAGPSWLASDGSTIVADGAHPVARVDRPGSIPELLLRVTTPTATPGTLSDVKFVQRLDTDGGAAPEDGCDATHRDERRAVHYSAEYRFFK